MEYLYVIISDLNLNQFYKMQKWQKSTVYYVSMKS